MDWPRVDATIRHAYARNGHEHEAITQRTPLGDLMAKDPTPDLDGMSELQLCDYAAVHNIALGEGLARLELIEAIKLALEINWEERVRGMIGMLDYFYADGPHPLAVYRRATAIVKAIRPKLVLNMSCEELAILCDDGKGRTGKGRATVSARIERIYNAPIRKKGMRGYKASFQKSDSAVHKYAAAQKGNQSRRGKDYLAYQKAESSKRKAA